jgi:NADH-quinone oxidoreductase subunit N
MTFPIELQIAGPEVILAIGALALLVVGAFRGDRSTGLVSALSGVVLIAAALDAAYAPVGLIFRGGFISDQASAFSKVAIYLMSAVAIFLGERWLTRLKSSRFEYPVLILLAALGMGMMVSAGDLISLYIGVELQSLALYVLTAFRRDDAKASEAALKYFVLGALSSGILLYGASLIYGFAGSTRFADIAHAVQGQGNTGLIFGVVFLACGLAFKVSAAPFHMWTPDVYEGAPTPVVAFIAAAPKLAAMVLFSRAMLQAFPGAVEQWSQVIVALAAISMAVGSLAGLVQRNLKRLLAYSSILNIGYALMALSTGTAMGMQAVFVFMVLYMIDVTGFFAALAALSRDGRPMEKIEDFAGLSQERPALAIVITVLSLSLLGLPPLSGFWAKFYVFKAALAAGHWQIAVFGLVASVPAAFYYLRIIKTMWFEAPAGRTDAPARDAQAVAVVSAVWALPLVLLGLVALDPLAQTAAKAFGLQ